MHDHQRVTVGRGPTIVLAAALIDGTGGPPLADPVVVIRDGRIAEITTRDAWSKAEYPDAQVLRDDEATIVPGLIDGHVHLVMSAADTNDALLRDLNESTPAELAMLAAENARLCLLGGVTTVRDCGGVGTLVQQLRDMIDAGILIGPRVLSSGMPITTTAGHCHFLGLRADSIEEVRKAVRQLVQDRVDVVKVMATGGRITSGSNIHALQYDRATLDVIAAEAHRLSRRVAAHVLCTDAIAACVDAGIDTLEHCRWQDPDGSFRYEEDVLERMAQRGTHVSLTMAGNIRDLLSARRRDLDAFSLGLEERERFRTESDMVRRGLNTFVTSDAGVTRCAFDEFPQSVACATHFLGLTPVDAIAHATGRAANALGIEASVGTLEPGKVADLVLVDGDVANDIDLLARVTTVMRSGRVVAQHGAVRSPRHHGKGPLP